MRKPKPRNTYSKGHPCNICGKVIKPLGWARHRAMHTEQESKIKSEADRFSE